MEIYEHPDAITIAKSNALNSYENEINGMTYERLCEEMKASVSDAKREGLTRTDLIKILSY